MKIPAISACRAVARCWEAFLGVTRLRVLLHWRLSPERWGSSKLAVAMPLRGPAITRQDDDLMFYGDDLLDLAVTCAVETPEDAKLAGETIATLMSTESR